MKWFAWFILLCPWTLLITALIVGLKKRKKAADARHEG